MSTDYVWENGSIVSQTMTLMGYNSDGTSFPIGPITTKPIYDKNNQAVGFMCGDDSVFMFVKNLQGDVIALVTGQGETMIEYSYDPWGKLEYHITDPNMDETLAMMVTSFCPLTYRGYNYDFSTGLYYLQSRYYSPEWGRLLNTDDPQMVLNTIGDNHGANQFAYCMNNPVNYTDKQGYWGSDVHNGWYSNMPNKKEEYTCKAYYVGRDFVGYVPYHYTRTGGQFYGTFHWAIEVGFPFYAARDIGKYDNNVDKLFNPVIFQDLHFNTNKYNGEDDSRLQIAAVLIFVSLYYFSNAEKMKNLSQNYDDVLRCALQLLGTALHCIQDFYAHDDDNVYPIFNNITGVTWSHIGIKDVDNANVRWSVVNNEVKFITKYILREIHRVFGSLIWHSPIYNA